MHQLNLLSAQNFRLTHRLMYRVGFVTKLRLLFACFRSGPLNGCKMGIRKWKGSFSF